MKLVFGALLAVLPVFASSLTFTLNPSIESGQAVSAGNEVLFSGVLTDTDTNGTCDSSNIDCLYLNFISFSFDQPNAPLTPDPSEFVADVPGVLSDDGIVTLANYTGPIFGMIINAGAAPGTYTGTVTISGGHNDPNPPTLNTALATAGWTVVVTPEPAAFGLAMAGFLAILLVKRHVAP